LKDLWIEFVGFQYWPERTNLGMRIRRRLILRGSWLEGWRSAPQIKTLDPPPCILKGVLKCSTHNPNAIATQNYSIGEDVSQNPCLMSTLEVLQTCPS
jgi:hypothetical protein